MYKLIFRLCVFPITAAIGVFLMINLGLVSTLMAAAPGDLSVVVMLGTPRSPELTQRITDALQAKGAGYQPRTEHLRTDGSPIYTNRLILEDSPYLIQHAHNPVDWHPWGPEVFALAKRENKPIFLSIGYSTCHWCHVMERESFENQAIARILNQHYISIKVDREQRPDVDEAYMLAVMLTAGHGGWPMSSFLTPEGKPFYGGTYFKPDTLSSMLAQIAALWEQDRASLEQQADRVAEAVARASERREQSGEIDQQVIQTAVNQALESHDELQGGFSQAPKFPQEPLLFLLLQVAERNSDRKVLEALKTTLDFMAAGGIHDQVGGGFHRYSTDNEWLVPHFEKMLYNQAHLARVYLLVWRLTGKSDYRRVAVQTLDYVLRDMTSPEGGFFSATDADSEDGSEGSFFLWTRQQITEALPKVDADLAIEVFGIEEAGNFEGSNILHLPVSVDESAKHLEIEASELYQRLDCIREALYTAREKRPQMLRDEKIITAWNGMMITALAQAGDLLQQSGYLDAAKRAANFVWDHNWQETGELLRVHLDGRSSVAASQEDYAYYAEGLLQLYDATAEPIWLERARTVADAMLEGFWDSVGGGFFMGLADQQVAAMGRPRDTGGDGAIPSGNSVALRVLQMLARRTDKLEYRTRADATLAGFAGLIKSHPAGFGYMLSAALELKQGEISARGYAAQGGIRIEAELLSATTLQVRVKIPRGWHINSDQPLQQGLIATKLSLADGAAGWELESVSYPPAETQRLGFQSDPLLLYQDVVNIKASFKRDEKSGRILPLQFRVQACNDKVCLPPERVQLRLMADQTHRD